MKVPICAGNWKLNKSPQESAVYLEKLLGQLEPNLDQHIILFPQAFSIPLFAEKLQQRKLSWGAQNCCSEDSGAFTGENSAQVLNELGATHCLVGHSERRHLFAESDSLIADKVARIQDNNLIPVVCIGETLEERQAGTTEEVIVKQINRALKKVKDSNRLIVAYEPVWAIGTGQTASPIQASEVHNLVRKQLADIFDEQTAAQIPLLYGGSVKPQNSAELFKQDDIDGFLVGGASLEVDSFLGILKTCI